MKQNLLQVLNMCTCFSCLIYPASGCKIYIHHFIITELLFVWCVIMPKRQHQLCWIRAWRHLTDSLFNLLYIEANQNVYAELKLNGSNDSVILNAKVGSRNVTLWKIKESLEKSKPEIFQSMVGNISRIQDGTFAGLMSAFDLVSNDTFDSRATKISIMHGVCGLNKNQIQLYDVILMSK